MIADLADDDVVDQKALKRLWVENRIEPGQPDLLSVREAVLSAVSVGFSELQTLKENTQMLKNVEDAMGNAMKVVNDIRSQVEEVRTTQLEKASADNSGAQKR